MKTKLLTLLLTFYFVLTIQGQYVYDYQAFYPVNLPELSPTKNFTFTKVNIIDNKDIVYSFVATSLIKPYLQGIIPINLNKNFEIVNYRTYIHPTSENSFLTANDVISAIDGSFVVCGQFRIENKKRAFIAKFDYNYSLLWYIEYPEITILNAIVENVTINSKVKYIACGAIESEDGNYGYGIIIGITNNGIPVWRLTTLTGGKSDITVYNDIKGSRIISSKLPLFAVVGNAITSPYSDKNVLLTLIDANGKVYFSNLYGLFNDGGTIYDEEAYGIDISGEGKIVVTGRCKQTFEMLPAIVYDDVLIFSTDIKGNVLWASRFDVPENIVAGEYGRKVIYSNNKYLISGYYAGYAFNEKASIDAFVAEFDPKFRSLPLRIYGDKGDDFFFAQEINFDYDGLISAGFTSSFSNDPTYLNEAYYPYVVETYKLIKKPCHSKWYETQNIPMQIENKAVKYSIDVPKYEENKLLEIYIPVKHQIICPKIPVINDTVDTTSSIPIHKSDSNIKIIAINNNSQLEILNIESNSYYQILSINGTVIKQGKLNDNICDISDLVKGIYFISIRLKDKVITQKFIK